MNTNRTNIRTDTRMLTDYEKDLLRHLSSKAMTVTQLRKRGMAVPNNSFYNTLTRLDKKGFLLFEGDEEPITFGLIGVAEGSIAEEIIKQGEWK